MKRRVAGLCVAVILGGVIWAAVVVRSTPVTRETAHFGSYPSGLGHIHQSNGHIWRVRQAGDGIEEMQMFDAILRATPRTQWVAGSVEEGMITYVTRSRLWAFPDVTTMQRNIDLIEGGPPAIAIHARSVFGYSDLGVNERRVRDWLAQAGR